MKKLAIVLLLVAGCSNKSDSNATATKPAEGEPAKTEPAKVEPAKAAPAKVEPAKVEPKPAAKADSTDASEADKKLVLEVGEATSIDWKSPTGETVKLAVKQRVDQKMYVTDLLENGKVIHTIQSGVEQGDIHMESRSAVKAVPGGVLFVVHAAKVTGKPSDSYQARFMVWSATQKTLGIERTINFNEEYDPSTDG